jgi:hypothetical protein
MTDRDGRCAYLIDEANGRRRCGAVRRPCSPYCAHHHGICYVVIGSRHETRALGWFEKLAAKAGKGRAPLGAA